MAWIYLIVAGLLEVVWATGLKYTDGLRTPWVLLGTVLAMAGSFYLLFIAMRTIPLSTAYPIWVGIGAVGATVAGVTVFGEALTPARALFVLLLLASVIGLKVSTA